MTIDQLQATLRAAKARIGYGRFALTFAMDGREDCYLTFWHRPDAYALSENCKAVASGTFDECMEAMDRYVVANRLRDEPPAAYSIAAE